MTSELITCPFFLSVPASAPRTECFCHVVAVASSSMLAPSGLPSIATRMSSFEMPFSLSVGDFGVFRREEGQEPEFLGVIRPGEPEGANQEERAPSPIACSG